MSTKVYPRCRPRRDDPLNLPRVFSFARLAFMFPFVATLAAVFLRPIRRLATNDFSAESIVSIPKFLIKRSRA